MLIIVSISCCCGARASHTLSTHTTQHLILRYVSYHRFCKHMCAQAITSRSITFATTRNTRAAKMSKIVSSLGHRAVLVYVRRVHSLHSCTVTDTRALSRCPSHSTILDIFSALVSRVVTYSKRQATYYQVAKNRTRAL